MNHVSIDNSISIKAPKETVWEILTGYPHVNTWGQVFMEGSTVEGDYVPNGTLLYKDVDGNGMKCIIREFNPGKQLVIEGVANLLQGAELKEGDEGYDKFKEWLGSTDIYKLADEGTHTTLTLTTTLPNEEMAKLFNESWERALAKIKELSEAEINAGQEL